ncbi:hypothetical protein L3X38_027758 [Prunus dulcis]|uniref:Uncharacterized protein n=1 Tax=Prunus dulcis TaxID=3755 RepID=A0AAD4VPD9_PRUDU|nr:hypothetical protein L3X38_027758 [Prunus dulcis]
MAMLSWFSRIRCSSKCFFNSLALRTSVSRKLVRIQTTTNSESTRNPFLFWSRSLLPIALAVSAESLALHPQLDPSLCEAPSVNSRAEVVVKGSHKEVPRELINELKAICQDNMTLDYEESDFSSSPPPPHAATWGGTGPVGTTTLHTFHSTPAPPRSATVVAGISHERQRSGQIFTKLSTLRSLSFLHQIGRKIATPRTGSAVAGYCPLWAWLHSHQPARFCLWEFTKQLPRVVTHPGIAPASNSLNFGVLTNQKPVSFQKASHYIDARCAI